MQCQKCESVLYRYIKIGTTSNGSFSEKRCVECGAPVGVVVEKFGEREGYRTSQDIEFCFQHESPVYMLNEKVRN